MESDERLTYNVVEASRILGLSRNATYLACLRGDIPSLRIGKRLIVPKVQLERMLSEAGKPQDWKQDNDCSNGY